MASGRMKAIPIRDAHVYIDGVDVTDLVGAPTFMLVTDDGEGGVETTRHAEIDAVVRRMLEDATTADPDGDKGRDPDGGRP